MKSRECFSYCAPCPCSQFLMESSLQFFFVSLFVICFLISYYLLCVFIFPISLVSLFEYRSISDSLDFPSFTLTYLITSSSLVSFALQLWCDTNEASLKFCSINKINKRNSTRWQKTYPCLTIGWFIEITVTVRLSVCVLFCSSECHHNYLGSQSINWFLILKFGM